MTIDNGRARHSTRAGIRSRGFAGAKHKGSCKWGNPELQHFQIQACQAPRQQDRRSTPQRSHSHSHSQSHSQFYSQSHAHTMVNCTHI